MDREKLKKKLLSREFRNRLAGWVGVKVGKREDVEEIVQDTLISALDSLGSFNGKAKLFTWTAAIARHEIADFYRKKKIKQVLFSRLPFLEELVSKALGPELAFQELETKKKIVRTFKALSEGKSKILRLKYIDNKSVRQIADELKITVKAAESRLTRARWSFQKVYVKEDSQDRNFTDSQRNLPFD